MNSLFVAWRPDMPHAGWRPVGRLEHDGDVYRYWYTAGARRPDFRPFAGMEPIDAIFESTELFPLFKNRLLSEKRPEYESFLRWSGFEPNSAPDPLLILGRTEGIRQTDAVEVFPCPLPDADGCYFNKFFLHGIRWMGSAAVERIAALKPGDVLKLMYDFQNEFDSMAVAVRTAESRVLLGYVPRYFAHDFYRMERGCDLTFIHLAVERVNLDAPLQNRLLCRVQACWPIGFQPCSGGDFEPIPAGISSRC